MFLGSVSSRCSGMSPRSSPESVRSSFVQIDQSGIRLPRLRRRNNYINYLCLHFQFRIHFIFFTWYLLRTFSGMFCVTYAAFYVLKKLTDFLAKQTHDTRKATYKNLNIFKRLNLLDECNRTAKVKSLKTEKT